MVCPLGAPVPRVRGAVRPVVRSPDPGALRIPASFRFAEGVSSERVQKQHRTPYLDLEPQCSRDSKAQARSRNSLRLLVPTRPFLTRLGPLLWCSSEGESHPLF